MAILKVDGKIVTVGGKPITTPPPVAEEATLTINVDGYEGVLLASLAYVDVNGEINGLTTASRQMTFPVTIKLLKGSCAYFSPSNWSGLPGMKNIVGCSSTPGSHLWMIYVYDDQASVTIYDAD